MAPPAGSPKPSPRPARGDAPSPLVIKLQIAGAVFVPMALLGVWLWSQGFFG